MAITTLDQALAGMQPQRFFFKAATGNINAGRPVSYWGIGGIPGAGTYSGSLAGAVLSGAPGGELPFINPPGGSNSYLSRFCAEASTAGKLLLCDRLWHNGGITATTSAQTVNSPTWPARDLNGSTNGVGVFIGAEVITTTAANAPGISISYTNSAGVSGRAGSNAFPIVASMAAGSFLPISQVAGDVGVQSVQSVTFTGFAPNASSFAFVAYRVIAGIELPGVFTGSAIDVVTGGMPQIWNDSVLFLLFIPGNLSAANVSGIYGVTQG